MAAGAPLAQATSIFGSPLPVGAIPSKLWSVGNVAVGVLETRGADGFLTLEYTLSDMTTGWEPLPYSTVLGGPATTGNLTFADGTRVYFTAPVGALRIGGNVTTGSLTLWFFGSPFLQGSGGGSSTVNVELGDIEADLNAILQAMQPQQVELTMGLEPIDELNRLPVALPGRVDVEQARGMPWPVQASGMTPTTFVFQMTALATGNGNVLDTTGMSGVIVQATIVTTATITWEVQGPDGTWNSVIAANIATGVTATTATASGAYWVPSVGFRAMRARISSWNSGAVTAIGLGFYGAPPYTIELMAQSIAGEDLTVGVLKVEERYSYQAVVAADTQVKGSAGFLHSVTISCNDAAPTAGSLIIYDSLTEANTQVFNHTFTTTPFPPLTILLDYVMGTGIYFGFTTTADVNVSASYR